MVVAVITFLIFVLAVITLSLAFMDKLALKKEQAEVEGYKRTYATITQVVYPDVVEGVRYYVSFVDNGRTVTAQTDCYSTETKDLNPGDTVKIGYFLLCENIARAVIFDDRVVPLSDDDLSICTVIGLLLLLTAGIMCAMNLRG